MALADSVMELLEQLGSVGDAKQALAELVDSSSAAPEDVFVGRGAVQLRGAEPEEKSRGSFSKVSGRPEWNDYLERRANPKTVEDMLAIVMDQSRNSDVAAKLLPYLVQREVSAAEQAGAKESRDIQREQVRNDADYRSRSVGVEEKRLALEEGKSQAEAKNTQMRMLKALVEGGRLPKETQELLSLALDLRMANAGGAEMFAEDILRNKLQESKRPKRLGMLGGPLNYVKEKMQSRLEAQEREQEQARRLAEILGMLTR